MIDTWHLIVYITGHIPYCVLSILLSIYFFMLFLIPVYTIIICSHVYECASFQFILTHSLGVLALWIYISRSAAIYYWSGIWRGSHTLRGARVPLFLIIGIPALLFMLFPDSIYITSSYHFFPLFICYYCVRYLYVILQWYWFIIVDFIPCSGYFRLSVCAWGIFLAYIRRRPSSRLRFRVFWEAGRDRIFLVSEPGST